MEEGVLMRVGDLGGDAILAMLRRCFVVAMGDWQDFGMQVVGGGIRDLRGVGTSPEGCLWAIGDETEGDAMAKGEDADVEGGRSFHWSGDDVMGDERRLFVTGKS